eukprot:gene2055-1243_t
MIRLQPRAHTVNETDDAAEAHALTFSPQSSALEGCSETKKNKLITTSNSKRIYHQPQRNKNKKCMQPSLRAESDGTPLRNAQAALTFLSMCANGKYRDNNNNNSSSTCKALTSYSCRADK